MLMQISRPPSLPEFTRLAESFLSQHEAEHGLMLGVAAATTNPAADAYWAIVLDRGAAVGAGLRTGTRLIVSREGAIGAMAALAHDAVGPHLHDVLGPRQAVESFVLATGGSWQTVMEQGIYECRAPTLPSNVPGARRVARSGDRERVAAAIQGVASEALGELIGSDAALARADTHIERASMHVWELGGEIVSLAAAVAPTPNGIRINNVYTPQALRGRGYAGALVASLTHALLESGRQFVFLHTDLSNPVSNRLYVRAGYRRVADLDVLRRDGANAPSRPARGASTR
jgi:predicted GNAT family acetyltransferase